jgi:hypothetical protein
LKFPAVSATLTHRPKVGDLRRTSTATSRISPSITRINFLRAPELQMQAAQRAADRSRVVVLNERTRMPCTR